MRADFTHPQCHVCAIGNHGNKHVEAFVPALPDKVVHCCAREMPRGGGRIGSESIKFIQCLLLKPYFHLLQIPKGPVSEL